MAFPFTDVFLALLFVYMIYSQWARLDSRYPIAAALALLVAAAVAESLGNSSTANNLALYAFFLLGAGVLLLLADQVRDRRAASRSTAAIRPGMKAESPSSDSTNEPESTTDQPLDRLEQ